MNKICKILLGLIVSLSTCVFAAVNINTANVEELQQLKGIGAKKAAEIVAYREAHGDFKNVDELTNVKGIGKATLEKLRQEIVVKNEDEAEVKDKSSDDKPAQSDINAKEVSKDAIDNKKSEEKERPEHKNNKL